MKKIIFTVLLLLVLISISVFVFIKSPFFQKVVTSYINDHTDLNVSIGSISFKEGRRLVISDLLVEEKRTGGFSLEMPHTEVRASIKGIIRKNIEELILVKPKLSFTYYKEDKFSIPFTVSKISVSDADVMIRFEKTGPVHFTEISVSLDSPPHEKNSILSGSAFVNGLKAEISGFVISGESRSPVVRGELSLRGEKLAWSNVNLRSLKARLPFMYEKGNFSGKNVSLQASEFVYPGLPEEKNIFIKGNIEGEISPLRFRINNLVLKTDFVKDMSADISITSGKRTDINAVLHYSNIDMEQISRKFLKNFLRIHGLSFKGTGKLRTVITASFSENDKPQISGSNHLTLADAGFSYGDETIISEGIEMTVSNSFEFALPFRQINFKFDSEAADFELLAGKFYGSFNDRVLSFSANGNYTKENNSLQITRSRLVLTNMGNIFLSGTVSNVTGSPLIDASIKITDLLNREAYNFFIRNTFQEEFPFLSRFNVDGESSAELHVKGSSGRFTARGNFQITDMNILNKDPDKAIRGISLTLPFKIEYPGASRKQNTVRFGSLRAREIVWSGIKLTDIEVDSSVWENDVIFREDIVFPVFGGNIIFRDVSYENIFSPGRQLEFSVDMENIDLEPASVTFSLPKFSGKLSGNIPLARLSHNRLLADGEINIDLFGGSVRVSDLSFDEVFSPVASLKASIEFNEIDLGQLTRTFDFGHISGLVRGKVDNLEIVNGQAQRFNVFLESYRKKGVDQTINVEALKKITILGTGASPSILDRSVYQFFREYKYEKLGFRASLENDNLRLLGIELKGDKGYLVKGGLLPPKVDVVNYVQNISFKEMVSRLKRIKQVYK